MLTICVGPNGSGKSLWALHQLIRFLREDKRTIVTSLAVDLPRLNEYLQQHYKDAPDVYRRVLKIGAEEMKTFWRYRGVVDVWTDGSDGFDGAWGLEPVAFGAFPGEDWRKVTKGVIYVLDEVQTIFGAREWQKTSSEFLAYQSQHRKLGDDVIAISPASALIDKQFRILAGECVALSNLYKLKIGPVKAPRKIIYRVFQNCPPAPGEEALARGSFTIDGEGLASCYNTAAGVGIVAGADADKGKESKGVPFWALFVGLAAACVVAYFGLSRGMNWAAKWGTRKVQVNPMVAAAVPGVGPLASAVVAVPVSPSAPVAEVERKIAGVVKGAAPGVLFLEDGRALKESDGYRWQPVAGGFYVPGVGRVEWVKK